MNNIFFLPSIIRNEKIANHVIKYMKTLVIKIETLWKEDNREITYTE